MTCSAEITMTEKKGGGRVTVSTICNVSNLVKDDYLFLSDLMLLFGMLPYK